MLPITMSVIASPTSTALALFLIQVLIIISLVRILGRLLIKIRQPMVIGEIIAGILLGPSAFGRIPGFTSNIFPPSSLKDLKLFADIGLIFFMFFLGLEVDLDHMRRSLKQSIPIAVCSIVVPFGCGAGLSVWFYDLESNDSNFVSFLLFLGTALSFTAFPVLARVLTSSQLLASPVGGQALGCAAVDDLLAWCTLALTLSYSSGGGPLNGLYVALISAGLILFLALVIHPFLNWYHELLISRNDELNRNFLALLFLLLCLTAWFSEILGIEAFAGSFIFGIMVPKGGTLIDNLAPKIELLIVEFFLPLYFANSGIRTDIGGLDQGKYWAAFLVVVAVGSAAKIIPVTLVGRWTVRLNKNGGLYNKSEAQSEVAGGDDLVPALHSVEQVDKGTPMPWRQCFTLGILMNTRGLVGLIVLNIGLSSGILGTKVFTIMVLFSLVTTFATPPSLYFLYEKPYHALRKAQLEAVALIRQQSALLMENGGLDHLKTPEEDHTCIDIAEDHEIEEQQRLEKEEGQDGVGEIHKTGSSKGLNGTQSKHGHMVLEEEEAQTHPALQASAVAAAASATKSVSPTPPKTNGSSPAGGPQVQTLPLTALQLEKQEAELLATQLAAFGNTTHASIEAARRDPSNLNLSGGSGGSRNKQFSRQPSIDPNLHPVHPSGSEWGGMETPMSGGSQYSVMSFASAPPLRQRQPTRSSIIGDFLLGPIQSPLGSETSNNDDTDLRSLSTRHAIALAKKKDAEEKAEIDFVLSQTQASRQRSGTLQGQYGATDDINRTQSSLLNRRATGASGGSANNTSPSLYDDINATGTSGFGRSRQLSNHGLNESQRRTSFDPNTTSPPMHQVQHFTSSPPTTTIPASSNTSSVTSVSNQTPLLAHHHQPTSSSVTGSGSNSSGQTTNSSTNGLTNGSTTASNLVTVHMEPSLPTYENTVAGGDDSTQNSTTPPFDRIESK